MVMWGVFFISGRSAPVYAQDSRLESGEIEGHERRSRPKDPPFESGRFEDALLVGLTFMVRNKLNLEFKPIEILETPSFMSPHVEGIVLLMGENTRMTIFLWTPPSYFAVEGKPTVWISPFAGFGYAIRVVPETELGQRLKQCLKLVNNEKVKKAVHLRICDVLSLGSKEKLEAIVARMNAKDEEVRHPRKR
jgi:hypothetical protein